MPVKPCLDCGALSQGPRCELHEGARRRVRNARPRPHRDRRPGYGNVEIVRRAETVAAWRAVHGELCPGWKRAPHQADAGNPLTADHLTPVAAGGAEAGPLGVLCRSCNSSKKALTC